MSDFSKAAARVSEGFCPLGGVLMRIRDSAGAAFDNGSRCDMCDVGWQVSTLDGRVRLTADRKLTGGERKFLYARR